MLWKQSSLQLSLKPFINPYKLPKQAEAAPKVKYKFRSLILVRFTTHPDKQSLRSEGKAIEVSVADELK